MTLNEASELACLEPGMAATRGARARRAENFILSEGGLKVELELRDKESLRGDSSGGFDQGHI